MRPPHAKPKQPPRPTRPEPHLNQPTERETECVFGLRAALAVAAKRPADLRGVFVHDSMQSVCEPLLRVAHAQRVSVTVCGHEELAARARSGQHEGVLVIASRRAWVAPKVMLASLRANKGVVIALDRVRNPYNIGAIMRSAAFFGLQGVLFGSRAPEPDLPDDSVRVAEGGVEHLQLSRTTDLADTLMRFRADGVHVVGAESDATDDALRYPYPRPSVLVLGHEREGISDRVRAQCDHMVCIRGAGTIESLNVAIAASLVIAALR
ncbi:MAG: RNA methyltransferase [Deltaproteobacteria bacterium]|nr:RNA methyltransferase [Deltaproteobacteria bacterium]